MGETENFKWDDKKFSGDGGDIAYTFKDNVITLEDNGETMTFTKTK